MTVLDKLVKIYRKTGYFERYGGSFFLTILFIIGFYFLISFFYTISNISNVKDNWEEHRCKYHILPFAGVLKKPKNSSMLDYTNDNLGYCINKSMDNMTDSLLAPVYFFVMVIFVILKSVSTIFDYLYKQILIFFQFLEMLLKTLRGYIINIIFQLQKTILVLRDNIKKTFGFFSSIVFFLVSLLFLLVGLIALTYHTGIALIIIVTTVLVSMELAIPIVGEILAVVTIAFSVAMGIILKPFGGLVDCLVQTPLGCSHSIPIKSIPIFV